MATLATVLLGVHALALAAVLTLARRDHVLVDEHGRPQPRAWKEHIVPAPEATSVEAG